jgi:hypothetical protein
MWPDNHFVLRIVYAEDGADPDYHFFGNADSAYPASSRVLHSFQGVGPTGLQAALLREQELLCPVGQK